MARLVRKGRPRKIGGRQPVARPIWSWLCAAAQLPLAAQQLIARRHTHTLFACALFRWALRAHKSSETSSACCAAAAAVAHLLRRRANHLLLLFVSD